MPSCPCPQALHQLRVQQNVVSLRLHWAQHRPATYLHDWAQTAKQKNVKELSQNLVCENKSYNMFGLLL